jgi:hypothetical protein
MATSAMSIEHFVDSIARLRVVLDRAAHAFDRLLRAVACLRLLRLRNVPNRRLLPITRPMAGRAPLRTAYQPGSCRQ